MLDVAADSKLRSLIKMRHPAIEKNVNVLEYFYENYTSDFERKQLFNFSGFRLIFRRFLK